MEASRGFRLIEIRMGTYSHAVTIRAPLADAWGFFNQPAEWPRWAPIVSMTGDHPFRPGDRLTQVRRDLGIQHVWTSVVTAVDPSHSMTARVEGGRIEGGSVMSFEPDPSDPELLTFRETVSYIFGHGALARGFDRLVLNPIVAFFARRKMRHAFLRFKQIVEAMAAVPSGGTRA